MKRLLMTGGGTAGHVTPNLALIPRLKALGYELHYVGQASGIERDLTLKAPLTYHAISAGKLRRYFDLQNFVDIARVLHGFTQALSLIKKLRPHLVFSKGGYVSSPVVWAAWVNRVPTIIHESDITPGLANRLAMPFANQICYSFPEAADKLPAHKAVYTGIPIRETLYTGDKDSGLRLCEFQNLAPKPTILVMGGSQGAQAINTALRATLDQILARFNICHLCGAGGINKELEAKPGYKQFTYVQEELPHLLALADVVVSRAGATTLFELRALKKPPLLIPLSLKASRGDQVLNAQSFTQQGFSHTLLEEDLTPETLLQNIITTYNDREALVRTMQKSGISGGSSAVERVINIIESCSQI